MTPARLTLSDAHRELRGLFELALTRPPRHAAEDIEIIENAKHELQVKVSASRREDESDDDFKARAVAMWMDTRAMLDYGLPVRDNNGSDLA